MNYFFSRILIALNLLMLFCTIVFSDNHKIEQKSKNVIGDSNAKNVLEEYASLSCVHCADFHIDRLPSIKKELINTGKLKYIYRDFPLDLPAMIASMVTHCYKGEQYFAVLNTLFRNQKTWVAASNNQEVFEESLVTVLKQHGITLDKIKQCTAENDKNKIKWNSILASRLDGQNRGVNSTPSFFLNGEKLDGLVDLKLLKKMIK